MLHRQVTFEMYLCPERHPGCGYVFVSIPWEGEQGPISYVAQVFGQPSAFLPRVVHLKLSLHRHDADLDDHINVWLRLLRQFSSTRTLHLSGMSTKRIAVALENVTGELVDEILPVLDLIYLFKLPVSCIKRFLETRRLSGHPVTIVDARAELYKSYGGGCENFSSHIF